MAFEGEPCGAAVGGITALTVERMGVTDAKIAEKQSAGVSADIGGETREIERFTGIGFKGELLSEHGEGGGLQVVAGTPEGKAGVPLPGFGGSLILEGGGKSAQSERGGIVELEIAGLNDG